MWKDIAPCVWQNKGSHWCEQVELNRKFFLSILFSSKTEMKWLTAKIYGLIKYVLVHGCFFSHSFYNRFGKNVCVDKPGGYHWCQILVSYHQVREILATPVLCVSTYFLWALGHNRSVVSQTISISLCQSVGHSGAKCMMHWYEWQNQCLVCRWCIF